MDDFVIKKAATTDFLGIAELDRASWGNEEVNKYIPDGEHAWRIWVEHALVFCCYRRTAIVGVALAFPTTSGIYAVHKVFVNKFQRGKGIGKALLRELAKELDKLAVDSFLTVSPNNNAAIAVYEAIGYKEAKLHRGFYREAEDRLVVVRRHIP